MKGQVHIPSISFISRYTLDRSELALTLKKAESESHEGRTRHRRRRSDRRQEKQHALTSTIPGDRQATGDPVKLEPEEDGPKRKREEDDNDDDVSQTTIRLIPTSRY